MSDTITNTNLEQTGEIFLGQPMLFEYMGICVLSPAHESEMKGYLVYLLIVKYLSHRFCLNSATIYESGRPYREIWGGFFKTFLEGSVDRVIYRDYIVNRRFFTYCRLACALQDYYCLSNTQRKWVVLLNVPQLLYFSIDLFQILCVCKLYNMLLHIFKKTILL